MPASVTEMSKFRKENAAVVCMPLMECVRTRAENLVGRIYCAHVEDVVVVVDLDAGAGLVGALDDGGGAAAGAVDGDRLLLGTVHLTERG